MLLLSKTFFSVSFKSRSVCCWQQMFRLQKWVKCDGRSSFLHFVGQSCSRLMLMKIQTMKLTVVNINYQIKSEFRLQQPTSLIFLNFPKVQKRALNLLPNHFVCTRLTYWIFSQSKTFLIWNYLLWFVIQLTLLINNFVQNLKAQVGLWVSMAISFVQEKLAILAFFTTWGDLRFP